MTSSIVLKSGELPIALAPYEPGYAVRIAVVAAVVGGIIAILVLTGQLKPMIGAGIAVGSFGDHEQGSSIEPNRG